MVDHLVPCSRTESMISRSSSAVHSPFFTSGARWLNQRSRHCFPIRPGRNAATFVHRPAPCSCTTRVSIASSSEVHACFFVRSFGLPSRTEPSCSGSASAVPPACAAAAIGLCATSDVAIGMRSWPKSSPVRAPPFESSTSKSPPCSHDMPAVAIESPAAEGCAASAGVRSGTAETARRPPPAARSRPPRSRSPRGWRRPGAPPPSSRFPCALAVGRRECAAVAFLRHARDALWRYVIWLHVIPES